MKKFFPLLSFFFLFEIILSNKQKQKLIEKETKIKDIDSVIVESTDRDDYEVNLPFLMKIT